MPLTNIEALELKQAILNGSLDDPMDLLLLVDRLNKAKNDPYEGSPYYDDNSIANGGYVTSHTNSFRPISPNVPFSQVSQFKYSPKLEEIVSNSTQSFIYRLKAECLNGVIIYADKKIPRKEMINLSINGSFRTRADLYTHIENELKEKLRDKLLDLYFPF